MSAASYTEAATAPAQETPTTEQGHKVRGVTTCHSRVRVSYVFTQIFVGNLAYATTDEGLKALFAGVLHDM